MSQPALLDQLTRVPRRPRRLDRRRHRESGACVQPARRRPRTTAARVWRRSRDADQRVLEAARRPDPRAAQRAAADRRRRARRLVRLHEGMDSAINEAMHRYATRREEVRERFIAILGHDFAIRSAPSSISANMLAAEPEPQVRAPRRRVAHRARVRSHAAHDQRRAGLRPRPSRHRHSRRTRRSTTWARSAAPPPTRSSVRIRNARSSSTSHGDLRGTFDRDRVHQAIDESARERDHARRGPIEVRAYESRRSPGDRDRGDEPRCRRFPRSLRERIVRSVRAGRRSPGHAAALASGCSSSSRSRSRTAALTDVHSDETGTTFAIRWPRDATRQRAACRSPASRSAPRATPAARSSIVSTASACGERVRRSREPVATATTVAPHARAAEMSWIVSPTTTTSRDVAALAAALDGLGDELGAHDESQP